MLCFAVATDTFVVEPFLVPAFWGTGEAIGQILANKGDDDDDDDECGRKEVVNGKGY